MNSTLVSVLSYMTAFVWKKLISPCYTGILIGNSRETLARSHSKNATEQVSH